MRNTPRKIRWTILLIAAWTISQTFIHISLIIYGYLMSTCRLTPKYCDLVYIYRTYFYRESCGSINVVKEFFFIEKDQDILYDFMNETVYRAVITQQNRSTNRTEMYLIIFFFMDIGFALSSVCLAVWAFNRTQQKYLSMIFYGPWLLCCGLSNFMDVVSSVHYGLDLIHIRSYTSWLKFIGVGNYQDFAAFNHHQTSSVLSTVPTIVMVSVLSRAFVVWLLNVICFFAVLFTSLPDFWRSTVIPRARSRPPDGRKLHFDTGEDLDLNSTEARIRSWQLFYGAVEANSTMNSNCGASPDSSASTSGADHNSDDKYKEAVGFYKETVAYDNPFYGKGQSEDSASGSVFEEFSDVASGGSPLSVVDANNANMPISKRHVPWYYKVSEEDYDRKHTCSIKHVRINSRVEAQVLSPVNEVPPHVFHLQS